MDANEFEYWKAASTTGDSSNQLREMWFNLEAGAPPQRQEPDEQRPGKRDGSVFVLPSHRTQENQAGEVRCVRGGVYAEAQQESEVVRKFRVQQDSRQDISRIAVGVKARVDRLKAIGNGQVPQCATEAWRRLIDRIMADK